MRVSSSPGLHPFVGLVGKSVLSGLFVDEYVAGGAAPNRLYIGLYGYLEPLGELFIDGLLDY